MRIPVTRPLFAWDCLEDSPSLRTVRDFLGALPDAKLLEADPPVSRIQTLAYDKAADTEAVHERLHDSDIKPLVQMRSRCASHKRCNAAQSYGKTIRVKREVDLRRFPPIPRATKTFEREYKGRTAVERVNARTKIFWGVDDGNVTGPERFHAHVGTVMLVHVGLATLLAACPRREGTLGQTRLSPIAQALHAKINH